MKRFPLLLLLLFLPLAGFAAAQDEPAALPGSDWQLLEIQPANADPIVVAEPESYTLRFDQDGRVYVRADCNRGSGSYDFSGAELQINELTSTLALCAPDSHYDAYMAALNALVSFELADDQLTLRTAAGASLLFASALEEEDATGSFEAQLRNATYYSRSVDRDVTLTDGVFEDHEARVNVTLANITYGDLNGDGLPDALLELASNSIGSGMFVELVAMLNNADGPQEAGSVLLGDRVKVESVSSAGSLIRVKLLTQGPGEPQCCPTMHVTQHYLLGASGLYQLPRDSFTDALFSGIYPSDHAPGGNVTLADGRFAIKDADVEFTLERVAFGDLNRNGRTDAAVIVRSKTAHGVFHELHAIESQSGKPHVLASESLGRDITLFDLQVEDGVLRVELGPAGETGTVLIRTYGLGHTPLNLYDEQVR